MEGVNLPGVGVEVGVADQDVIQTGHALSDEAGTGDCEAIAVVKGDWLADAEDAAAGVGAGAEPDVCLIDNKAEAVS